MYKKEITYTDFNGVECKETVYFNLTKTELTTWDLQHSGTFSDYLTSISEGKHVKDIYNIFSEIVDRSYGVKSEDGKRFVKTSEALADFKASAAYDQMMIDILSDASLAVEFIQKVMPKDLMEKAKELDNKN